MTISLANNLYSLGNDEKKVKLLKDTFCKNSTHEELMLFVHACERSKLDPFMRQIHAVKRWDANLKRESMTIQTGIDGYRLIAERTGCYSPGREPSYTYDDSGQLESATAYVKKMTKDGTWHEISATAFFEEYCQRNKEGKPISMWQKMARNQLAKCAESLALRRAFPSELSGIYTKEEMEQAENVSVVETEQTNENEEVITTNQVLHLMQLLSQCSDSYVNNALTYYKNQFGISEWNYLPKSQYEKLLTNIQNKLKETKE